MFLVVWLFLTEWSVRVYFRFLFLIFGIYEYCLEKCLLTQVFTEGDRRWRREIGHFHTWMDV